MPSVSDKQKRFMAACAHGAGYANCPSPKVSKEFNQADQKVGHYKKGGLVEKRDPSSHRTPSQIQQMDRTYNATSEMERRRNEQNKARRMLHLKKGDPRDAGHVRPLDKGGKTVSSNLEPQSQKKNRGWARDWKA